MDDENTPKVFRRRAPITNENIQAFARTMLRADLLDDDRVMTALEDAGLDPYTAHDPCFPCPAAADESMCAEDQLLVAFRQYLSETGDSIAAARFALEECTTQTPEPPEGHATNSEIAALVLCSDVRDGSGPHLTVGEQWRIRCHVLNCDHCRDRAMLAADVLEVV